MPTVHYLDHVLHFFNRVDVWTELPRAFRLRAWKRIASRITSRDGEAEECVESPKLVEPFGGDRTMSVEEASDHLRCGFVEIDGTSEAGEGVQLKRAALVTHAQGLLVGDIFPDGVSDFHATPPRPTRTTSRRPAISPTL